MNTLKTLLLGAVLTASAAVYAQQPQPSAVQTQAAALIKSGDPKAVAAYAKEYKKDPAALSDIARAYMVAKQYPAAKEYAQKAIEVLNTNKKVARTAAPYLIMGNACVAEDNGGEAATWFEQAIYADPKNPDGYRRYAQIMQKADPVGSVQKLEDLRAQRPDYPVDLIAADIFNEAGRTSKAVEYYSKVKLADMQTYQLGRYAFCLFVQQNYQKSLEVAEFGLKGAPRSATLNRLALYNNGQLKNYDAALAAADRLFNASDSVKIVSDDYGQLINALRGAKKYDEALEQLKRLAADPTMPKADQIFALKQIAETYADKEDYANSIPAYQEYLAKAEKPTATEYAAYAQQYLYSSANLKGAEKAAALQKADAAFDELTQKFPDAVEYAVFQRARVAMQMDPDSKQGLAKPFYDRLLTMPDVSAARKKEALNYNMAYAYIVKNDLDSAITYAEQILQLDPENEGAKNVMSLKK